MFYQFRVDFCQALPIFEHYIGCILPLIQHPIISLRKYLFYSGQNGIYLPGKRIKCLRKIDVNKHLRSRITTSNFPVSLLPRVSNDTHGSTIVMTQISPSFIPSSSCIFRATSSFLILLESSGINGRPSLPDSSRALSLISPDTFFAYLPKSLNNTFS